MPRTSIGLEKVDLWPVEDVRRIADEHVTKFRKRVEDDGQDYRGHSFKRYSKAYRRRKASDFRKQDGGRYKGYQQAALSNQIDPPNLRLTGRMLRDFRRRSQKKDEYVIGFSGEAAEKAQWNKESGRDIITSVPDKELDWVAAQLGKEADREFKKKLKRNVRIRIE